MLLDAISKAGTIALGGHVRPDGDCAGSCMGLYNYVREIFLKKRSMFIWKSFRIH